jgi:hypothetical protein
MAVLAWGGRPTAGETCMALVNLLAPGSEVITSLPEGAALSAVLRAHLAPWQLFQHDTPRMTTDTPRPEVCGDAVFVLASRDCDAVTGVPLPWPAPASVCGFRARKLDTLYADSHTPGMLVFGGNSSVGDVIAGARGVLSRHRPMLLLDFSDVAPAMRASAWEDCVQACEDYHYTWLDGLFLPCSTSADRNAAVTAIGHATGVGLPTEWPDMHKLPPGIADMLAPEDADVARVTWAGTVASVKHIPTPDGVRIRFDNTLPSLGMYRTEHGGQGACWRWTGPGPRASFLLPVPGPGPWRLQLEVVNWGSAKTSGALRALVAGEFLTVERSGEDFISFSPLAPPPFWSGGSLQVDLTTPRPRRVSAQDARCLGVSLAGASLSRI